MTQTPTRQRQRARGWIIWIWAAAFSLLMSASYFILASQAWHMGLLGVVWAVGAVILAARALYGRAHGGS